MQFWKESFTDLFEAELETCFFTLLQSEKALHDFNSKTSSVQHVKELAVLCGELISTGTKIRILSGIPPTGSAYLFEVQSSMFWI